MFDEDESLDWAAKKKQGEDLLLAGSAVENRRMRVLYQVLMASVLILRLHGKRCSLGRCKEEHRKDNANKSGSLELRRCCQGNPKRGAMKDPIPRFTYIK